MFSILSTFYRYYRKRNSEDAACTNARLAFVFFSFLYLIPITKLLYSSLENVIGIDFQGKSIRYFATLAIITIIYFIIKKFYSDFEIIAFDEMLDKKKLQRNRWFTILFIVFSFIFVIFLY